MIRNRELLGLPDVFASLKFPIIPEGEAAEKHFSLSVRMKLKKAFSGEEAVGGIISHLPAAEVIPFSSEVLLIDPEEGSPAATTTWTGTADVMGGIYEFVRSYATAPGREKLLQRPLFQQAAPFAMMNRWVNLKQFRSGESDRSQPGKTSYQSIIEYAYQPMQIRGGGRMDGGFVIQFPRIDKAFVDSLQFAFNLGVAEANPVRAAYWIDFDYELYFRNVIWEAK
jgi:hypothetical protein